MKQNRSSRSPRSVCIVHWGMSVSLRRDVYCPQALVIWKIFRTILLIFLGMAHRAF